MKALVLEEYNNLVYKEVPMPQITDEEVLIRVKACGICGSDVHGMDGSTGRRIPPIIMGHEASGVIEGKGKLVGDWKIGDRVTFDSTVYPLNDWFTLEGNYNLSDNREVIGVSPGEYKRHGAFAGFVAVPQHILYRIPEKLSFEEAAMTEPVAVALHAIKQANPVIGETAVVVGAGMVGIFIVQLLSLSGLSNLIVIDTDPDKREKAKVSGANMVFDPSDSRMKNEILSATKGRGVDVSFEVVGLESSVGSAIDLLRKGGRSVLVGNISTDIKFPLQKVVTRELKIFGSCAIRGEYESVLELIASGKVNVKDQISVVAPLSEGAEWFKRLKEKGQGLNKVILVP